MFKRVERKRKRREEEEELGLDEDAKEIMGLNDTDSDESDSGSEQESVQSNDLDPDIQGEDRDQDQDAASEDEGVNNDPPLSVAEALKDPIYLISLDPTVHGCVLCKGKLIKNAGMATTHKNATVCIYLREPSDAFSLNLDSCRRISDVSSNSDYSLLVQTRAAMFGNSSERSDLYLTRNG
jgi:hypothetical protein